MQQNDKEALTLLDPAEYDYARELFADLAADHLFAVAVRRAGVAGSCAEKLQGAAA